MRSIVTQPLGKNTYCLTIFSFTVAIDMSEHDSLTVFQVQLLSSKFCEESRRVNAAKEREESLRKIVAELKKKHVETEKEVEIARKLLAEEACERQIAESKALQQSLEKQKVVDTLLSCDGRYRRLTREEIQVATDSFSESKIIGEGGYGIVYKGNLDHTPVAIKALHPNASLKKEEFLKEVLFPIFFWFFWLFKIYAFLAMATCHS